VGVDKPGDGLVDGFAVGLLGDAAAEDDERLLCAGKGF